ncbi:predicted protein [Nematostella vectensis]|uniref:Uncharacterized protein n=1 Tax=Nematostella vectensis TaxID=45351 RepID=A7SJJ5_NEMVE|nr:predicted protein [Nematostella vectensis]|eukprot:XP_001628195.1 predicted protein [Nematostella vectensis]
MRKILRIAFLYSPENVLVITSSFHAHPEQLDFFATRKLLQGAQWSLLSLPKTEICYYIPKQQEVALKRVEKEFREPNMKKDAFETSNQTNFSVFDENEDIRQKRKKLISEFSGYTTLHGLHFLIDSGSLFRKVFWMILLLVMFTCFFIQLVESYKRLKEYGSNLSKGVESPEEVTFPAITICNQNMMRKSLVMGTDAQKYLDGQDIMKIKLGAAQVSNESFEVDKMVREKGHLLESMLFECSFAGTTCTPENFTTSLSFTKWKVLNFGSGKLMLDGLKTRTTDAAAPVNKSILSPQRGLCYTFNSGTNNTPVFTARAADIRMAFSAMLFSQPEEYYGPFSHRATGFKIAIHDQSETPDIDLESYDLSPGFATNIRLIREKAKYLPAPYSSNCSSKRGIDGGTYSETGCLTRCYNNLMTSQCQCKILGHESDYKNITGFCSTYQLKACVYEAWMVLRPQNCDCPKPCTSLKYKAQISTSYFPSESLWESLIPFLGQSSLPFVNLTGKTLEQATAEAQVNVRKSVCMVNVFFETLVTDILEEKPSYDLTMFGGTDNCHVTMFGGTDNCNMTNLWRYGCHVTMFGGTDNCRVTMFGGTDSCHVTMFGVTDNRNMTMFGGTDNCNMTMFGGTDTCNIAMFGADLGGTMGLFLGCSILTICEFIDLVIILVANGWRKGKARVIDVKEKPEARP